jgi:hypothetical protein
MNNFITIGASSNFETVQTDNHLLFKNGRLYIKEIPYEKGSKSKPPRLIDVTEDLLNTFIKILGDKECQAKQASIIEQLKNR